MDLPAIPFCDRCRRRQGACDGVESKLRVVGLLALLGVPAASYRDRARRGNASFWRRRIDFGAVLAAAHKAWRRQMRDVHPDRSADTAAVAACLNGAWRRVRERFKRHGYELE